MTLLEKITELLEDGISVSFINDYDYNTYKIIMRTRVNLLDNEKLTDEIAIPNDHHFRNELRLIQTLEFQQDRIKRHKELRQLEIKQQKEDGKSS
jgi:hypothetical protein